MLNFSGIPYYTRTFQNFKMEKKILIKNQNGLHFFIE